MAPNNRRLQKLESQLGAINALNAAEKRETFNDQNLGFNDQDLG